MKILVNPFGTFGCHIFSRTPKAAKRANQTFQNQKFASKILMIVIIFSFRIVIGQDNPKALEYLKRGIGKLESTSKVTEQDKDKNPFIVNELLESARTDFNSAISIDPGFTEAYFRRGLCFYKSYQYKKAITDFEKVLAKDDNNFEALRWLSSCKIQDSYSYGNPTMILTETMEILNRLIKLKQTDYSLYFERSLVKMRLQDFRGAIADVTESINLLPDYYYYFSQRALYWHRLNNYAKSIEDYTKAISLASSESALSIGSLYNSRAYAKIGMDDVEGACLDWSKAGELGVTGAYEAIRTHCN